MVFVETVNCAFRTNWPSATETVISQFLIWVIATGVSKLVGCLLGRRSPSVAGLRDRNRRVHPRAITFFSLPSSGVHQWFVPGSDWCLFEPPIVNFLRNFPVLSIFVGADPRRTFFFLALDAIVNFLQFQNAGFVKLRFLSAFGAGIELHLESDTSELGGSF